MVPSLFSFSITSSRVVDLDKFWTNPPSAITRNQHVNLLSTALKVAVSLPIILRRIS